MLKLSKLADYGVVIMAFLVRHPDGLFTSQVIAEKTKISQPTASKLLKRLTRAKLIYSTRGISGGYQLAVDPEKVKLTSLLEALEEPLMLTACHDAKHPCQIIQTCSMIKPWMKVNHMIYQTLDALTLKDFFMTTPTKTHKVTETA